MNAYSPTRYGAGQRSIAALSLGLLASLAIHLTLAATIIGYSRSSWAQSATQAPEILVSPELQEPEKIELGIDESEFASISWLGVHDRPVEGIAEESVVEQAALAINPGANAKQEPQEPTVTQRPTEQVEPVPEPPIVVQEPVEIVQDPTAPNPADVVEVQPAVEPETVLVESAQDEPEDSTEQLPVGPDLVAQPEPEPEEVQPELQPETQPEVQPVEQPVEKPAETKPQTVPSGAAGELAKKEAVATAIREASDIKYKEMHRPMVAHGLEILPKEPKYPLSVRNNALPRNAIVMIRFGRDGRVKYAGFLVSADGKKRFDTGREEVDSPLIAAIYQWTAKGKRLLELEEGDPKAYVEIPMRILFSKPQYDKTGG
jgi:hypothetical protein